MVPRGRWNCFVGVLGVPGTGKSTHALALAVSLQKKYNCYVVAHDTGWRLPEKFPGGAPTGVIRHETTEDARQALKNSPAGIHCISSQDAAEVCDLALAIGEKSLERATRGPVRRMGKNQRLAVSDEAEIATPVLVVVDEVAMAKEANAYRLGDSLARLISMRRHRHVGVIWTCQSPRQGHYRLMELATSIYCFRLTSAESVSKVSEYIPTEGEGGEVTRSKIASISSLPNYRSFHFVCDASATENQP
jgi:hypothetical protein